MIRVVSLFCGIGNADSGLYAAADELGIEVQIVDAIDSWQAAVSVYNANLRHPVARVANVKTMARADLHRHDLVIGGPPCTPYSFAGKRLGAADPRDCLPDFMRLAHGSAWLMENVRPGLVNAPWSDKFCALDFGDVTTRKRWFYSSHLLSVQKTPSPRRIRDIRDKDEAHVRIGMRGSSKAEHLTTFGEDGALGSILANTYRSTALASRSGDARCPSLLEMARAHSIPDDFDWNGSTKTSRGRMIANAWPRGMAKSVCKAMLVSLSTKPY